MDDRFCAAVAMHAVQRFQRFGTVDKSADACGYILIETGIILQRRTVFLTLIPFNWRSRYFGLGPPNSVHFKCSMMLYSSGIHPCRQLTISTNNSREEVVGSGCLCRIWQGTEK